MTVLGQSNCPWHGIWDPAAPALIIPNFGASDVQVLLCTPPFSVCQTFYTVPVGYEPDAVGYDPVDGQILVANFGSNNVTILSADNLAHLGDCPVGTQPSGIAFDPVLDTGANLIANYGSGNVTTLSFISATPGGARTCFSSSISVGSGPEDVVWDEKAQSDFVPCSGTHDVYVVQLGVVVRHFALSSTAYSRGAAYSDYSDEMYIADSANGELFVHK